MSMSLAPGYDAASSWSTGSRLLAQLEHSAQAQSSMATRSSSLHSRMALRSARAEVFAAMGRHDSFPAAENKTGTRETTVFRSVSVACGDNRPR